MGKKVCHSLEISRYVLIGLGIFIAGFQTSAEIRFSIVTFFFVLAITGLSGIEGYFFGQFARKIVGYEGKGSSGYQKQSALSFLAISITTIIVYMFNWGIKAQLAMMTLMMIFILLSGFNHLVDALKYGNKTVRNFIRPFAALLLLAAVLYYTVPIL